MGCYLICSVNLKSVQAGHRRKIAFSDVRLGSRSSTSFKVMVAKKTVRSGLSAVEEDLFCSECNNACASQPPHTSKEPNISYTDTEKKERKIVLQQKFRCMYVCILRIHQGMYLCMSICALIYMCLNMEVFVPMYIYVRMYISI